MTDAEKEAFKKFFHDYWENPASDPKGVYDAMLDTWEAGIQHERERIKALLDKRFGKVIDEKS